MNPRLVTVDPPHLAFGFRFPFAFVYPRETGIPMVYCLTFPDTPGQTGIVLMPGQYPTGTRPYRYTVHIIEGTGLFLYKGAGYRYKRTSHFDFDAHEYHGFQVVDSKTFAEITLYVERPPFTTLLGITPQ